MGFANQVLAQIDLWCNPGSTQLEFTCSQRPSTRKWHDHILAPLLSSSQTSPKTSQTTLAFQSKDPTSPNTTDTEEPLSTNPRLPPHHPSPSHIIRVLIFFSVFSCIHN